MPSIGNNLTRVVMPDDISAWLQYIKGKGWEVILRPCSSRGANSVLFQFFFIAWYCLYAHWETHSKVRAWSSGWHQMASVPSSISRSEHHRLLWDILVSRVWSGFPLPSSLKAFLPQWRVNIQLLTVQDLQGSTAWGTDYSERWSYFLVRYFMLENCLKSTLSLNTFNNPKTFLYSNPLHHREKTS